MFASDLFVISLVFDHLLLGVGMFGFFFGEKILNVSRIQPNLLADLDI